MTSVPLVAARAEPVAGASALGVPLVTAHRVLVVEGSRSTRDMLAALIA